MTSPNSSATDLPSGQGLKSALSQPLQRMLEEHRERLNALVRTKTKSGSAIDLARFNTTITDVLGPIIDSVYESNPDRASRATWELFSMAFDLCSSGLLGTDFRSAAPKTSVVNDVWISLLPSLGKWIGADPKRVAGMFTNASLNLSRWNRLSVEPWLDRLRRCAPYIQTLEQLVTLSTVSAWASGAAQFRTAAVKEACSLPDALLAVLFQDLRCDSIDEIRTLLERLAQDPWADIVTEPAKSTIIQVAECGSFRGFGGQFPFPPTVSSADNQLIARSGDQAWLIIADRFGCVLIPTNPKETAVEHTSKSDAIHILPNGEVRWLKTKASFPELATCSSSAFDGTTLAVTIPTSFHVMLLTRRG